VLSAKDSGRNRVQLYKPDDMPERHREMHWVPSWRVPATRAASNVLPAHCADPAAAARAEHFELMLRLRDESGTIVTPAEFIPAAERYNIMPSIDRWVVRQALDRLVHRIESGVKPFTIAVNLSGTSLNDERFWNSSSPSSAPPAGRRRDVLRDHRNRGDREPEQRRVLHARLRIGAATSRSTILAAACPRSCI